MRSIYIQNLIALLIFLTNFSVVADEKQLVADDTIDAPSCQHEGPASIAIENTAKALEISAMTRKQNMAIDLEGVKVESGSFGMGNQGLSMGYKAMDQYNKKGDEKKRSDDADKENIKKILDNPTVEGTMNQQLMSATGQLNSKRMLLEGMQQVLLSNEEALKLYKIAHSKATEEALHDKLMFNECAASLIVDSFNAMEHVRYFYPRQVSDGSYKTFENLSRDNIEVKAEELAKVEDFESVFALFSAVKGSVQTLSAASIEKFNGGPGYYIDSRLKSFWSCSIASSATYSYLRWARRSQRLGNTSVEQYDKKKEIIEESKEFLEIACKGVLDEKLHPAPTSMEICNAWMEDTLTFSQKCSNKGDVDDSNNSWWREMVGMGANSASAVHLNNSSALEGSAEKLREI